MKKISIPFDSKTLFKKIRELRGGQSLEEFSKKYGIAHTTLKNYETSRVPPFEFIFALHKKEGVSLDWLVEEDPGKETTLGQTNELRNYYQTEVYTAEEKQLVEEYRAADGRARKTSRVILRMDPKDQKKANHPLRRKTDPVGTNSVSG